MKSRDAKVGGGSRPAHEPLLQQLRSLEVEVARIRAALSTVDAVVARDFPASFKMLAFRSGDSTLGVLTESVREVTRVVRVEPISGAPASVLGSMNYRGALVPLVDLGHRLTGRYTACTLDTPIVVLARSVGPLAILVQRVLRVEDVLEGELVPARGELATHAALVGTVERDAGFVHVLDAELLLASDESEELSAALSTPAAGESAQLAGGEA